MYGITVFTSDRLSSLKARLDAAIDGPEEGARIRAQAIAAMVRAGVPESVAESVVPAPVKAEPVDTILQDMSLEELAVLVRLGLGAAPSRLRQATEKKTTESDAQAS